MNESVNELMNDGGVYRTAPATPGLLKRLEQIVLQSHILVF